VAAYLEALRRDLAAAAALAAGRGDGRAIDTIFLGGGTPSLLTPEEIAQLLAAVAAEFPLAPGLECTLEANPGASEHGRFADYRAAGVTRLSLGVQSLRSAQLTVLGRIHGVEEAERAIAAAAAAGFASVNVDLMYGTPGDTVAGAVADLARVAALGVGQISWYQLTIEPDTAFGRRPPSLPGEEEGAEIEAAGRAFLAGEGYARYEISAYARPGHRCRHNLHYWTFADYLGIGAGAHGKRTVVTGGEGAGEAATWAAVVRTCRPRNPGEYMLRVGMGAGLGAGLGAGASAGSTAGHEAEAVATAALPLEFLMNALRLVDGVPAALFPARTGLPLAVLAEAWAAGVARGLLGPVATFGPHPGPGPGSVPVATAGIGLDSGPDSGDTGDSGPDTLRCTPLGLDFLDDCLALFLPAAPAPDPTHLAERPHPR
jgi:oxygen-independent coproporphyrinogen-3 oxidase